MTTRLYRDKSGRTKREKSLANIKGQRGAASLSRGNKWLFANLSELLLFT
jgi:hypothetical protein